MSKKDNKKINDAIREKSRGKSGASIPENHKAVNDMIRTKAGRLTHGQ